MLRAAAAQELQVELVYKAHAHPADGFAAREGDDVSRLLRSLADHPSLRAVQARPRADGGRLGLMDFQANPTPHPCITNRHVKWIGLKGVPSRRGPLACQHKSSTWGLLTWGSSPSHAPAQSGTTWSLTGRVCAF